MSVTSAILSLIIKLQDVQHIRGVRAGGGSSKTNLSFVAGTIVLWARRCARAHLHARSGHPNFAGSHEFISAFSSIYSIGYNLRTCTLNRYFIQMY